VAKGLASHYLMQKAKLQNRDKLIDLQKFARESKGSLECGMVFKTTLC
jgi:hypothetical protein